jgi:uroporphyrinogen-III synthase
MADFIITIRPEPDASRDVDWLRRYQVPAMAVPVMRAEQQSFDLPDTPPFQAIIFTSRHAVAAIAGINGIASIDKVATLGALRSLPVYAVGRRTALAARQAGFDDVTTGPGDGNALVPLMVANLNPNAGDILWPSASIISFDIASRLADFGYSIRQIPVYAMVATKHVSDDLPARLAACSSAAVVAMSARSMDLFLQMLNTSQFAVYRKRITVIASSKVIAAAAGSGWADIIVAKAPRRSRVLAIATLIHHRRGKVSRAL